jgi:hypothetical protein
MDFLGDNGDIHVRDFMNKSLDLIHFQQSLNRYRVLPLYNHKKFKYNFDNRIRN